MDLLAKDKFLGNHQSVKQTFPYYVLNNKSYEDFIATLCNFSMDVESKLLIGHINSLELKFQVSYWLYCT